MKNQFQELQREWYRKLKDVGFEDIEDSKGNIKQHNRRTISFENRDIVSDFISDIGHFLGTYPDIPELHKKILELYCDGLHISKIATEVKRHRQTIWNIIVIYRDKLRVIR